MTGQVDVEALLSAVRTLIAAREEAENSPLVLTEDQRIADPIQPEEAPDGDGYVLPRGSAVLRDFARLTLAERDDDHSDADGYEPDEPFGGADADPLEHGSTDDAATEPAELAALRALVREVLRDEVRSRIGHRISDDIRRIVREELDTRFGASGGG